MLVPFVHPQIIGKQTGNVASAQNVCPRTTLLSTIPKTSNSCK